MRILAIGDIHGCFTALQTLAKSVDFQPADTVIALGDYVDRGPDSKAVIDFLIDLKKKTNLITLRGNHEIMMLQSRDDDEYLEHWRECGGEETIQSYGTPDLSGVPSAHWDFLGETIAFHEMENDFFVHANASPDLALKDQPEYMLYWEHLLDAPAHSSGKRMICGHTRQKNGLPWNIGHLVCIDTWAYGTGWLTCLDVSSGHYWQANQDGEARTGKLD